MLDDDDFFPSDFAAIGLLRILTDVDGDVPLLSTTFDIDDVFDGGERVITSVTPLLEDADVVDGEGGCCGCDETSGP
jgi:hypothetical protein